MDKVGFVIVAVKCIVYLQIILGIWMIFSDAIIHAFRQSLYSRFRKRKYDPMDSTLLRYTYMLISVTCKGSSVSKTYGFILVSFGCSILMFLLLIQQNSLVSALGISIFFGAVPFLFLYIRLSTIRTEGSYEAEIVVSELLNLYKINYYNMVEAIDQMVCLKEAPVCRRAFYRLSIQLKSYNEPDHLVNALKEVAFMVNTDWMKMLANNIYLAIEEHTNVCIGLEDILKELRQAKTTHEKAKQMNIEGISILKFLSPVMYMATIYMAIKYFGFTIKKFIAYQFYTDIGLKFFMLILFLMIMNIGLMILFKRKKFDF